MEKNKPNIEEIKKKYNVDDIFSWSKYSTYLGDPYEYLLKYIKKIKPDMDGNAYSYLGSIAHAIIESYNNKEIDLSDMHKIWDEKLMEFHIMGLKYDKNDKKNNKKIAKKYEECVSQFFKEYRPSDAIKIISELFMVTMIGKYLFQGYIDEVAMYDSEFIVTDHKTSTVYRSKKLEDQQTQLIIYGIGMHQNYNLPYEKMRLRWNFLKYISASYKQQNGKYRSRRIDRNRIVEMLEVQIIRQMRNVGYSDIEIDNNIAIAKEHNNFALLPTNVQDKFIFDNYYVYVEINEDIAKKTIEEINNNLDKMMVLKNLYEETNDDKLFWQDVTKDDIYYLSNLGSYSSKIHKPWAEYIKKNKEFLNNKKTRDKDMESIYGKIFSDI